MLSKPPLVKCAVVFIEPILVAEATIMDRFLKTCLVLVVLLLAVSAFRTVVSPHSVQAKTQHKYVAVMSYGSGAAAGFGIQADLDKYAADGWELAAPIYVGNGASASTGELHLIFRK